MKNGYVLNIEKETLENVDYRRVLYTANGVQLVLMSVEIGGEIGEEVHHLDQFIRVEQGEAAVTIDGVRHEICAHWAVIVPRGAKHNVVNIGKEPLKLYTLYGPPAHLLTTVQPTKADEKEEHFDGKTTE